MGLINAQNIFCPFLKIYFNAMYLGYVRMHNWWQNAYLYNMNRTEKIIWMTLNFQALTNQFAD